jgi:hypothetical protein
VTIPSGTPAPPVEQVPGAPEPPPAPGSPGPADHPLAPANVFFSDPFDLEGGQNVELRFYSSLTNDWSYVVASLVNEATGDVVSVDAAMEYYSGVEDGESWSEGNPAAHEVVGPVTPGKYVLRLETQHGSEGVAMMSVVVRQGVFRGRYLGLALGVLGVPFLIFGIYTYSFERRRWSNSTEGSAPKTPFVIIIGAIVLVLTGILAIFKAFGSSSDDD